jgi:uncharacterized protein YbbC (DUF1343 family)
VVRVSTGLEQLLVDDRVLRGRRIGLIANPTAVTAELDHAVDRLAARSSLALTALFGPEHGVRGDAQDMIGVQAGRDSRSGLPVHSLYGHGLESLTPTAAMLEGVDVLVYDVQDVGARYYTVVWTMVLAMRAAAAAGKSFVVLDRPNPIGGVHVEGGAIAAGFESFVGLVSCPNRHGLTAGEIARWRATEEKLDLDLMIIPMVGWRREMSFEDTGLPWVMPSPNMPTCDTARVYPGMCLVEGTELSEGRGTTRPFELVGAPELDSDALAAALTAEQLPGARFRPCTFTPTFQKHSGRSCGGVQIHIVDRHAFRPYRTGIALLAACRRVGGGQFAWRTRAYEFVDTIPAIDLLTGSSEVRAGIDGGASLADLEATWIEAERAFVEIRRPYLLYL